jgi:glycolate oxidase FAD binding subunit
MQRLLAQHGQMVALDPLWPERATVGGVLSANDSGALRGRYGSARDLVIGMTLVLADGTIAKTGGKVVKNVAGYDLHKLMIGAWGTLAVMTEVTFRLHPFAGARAVHSFHAERAELLMEFARTVCAEHLNPEALQVRTAEAGYVLDVQLVGSEAGIAAKNEHMREVASSCRVEQLPVFPAGVFAAREQMVADAGATRVKATMPPSALPEALVAVRTAGGSAVAYPTGILYAKFANGVEVPAGLERCVRETNGGVTVLGQPVAYTPLMREIKRQFDARDTLNRGFVGGM